MNPSKIIELDSHVINQIAAGEVLERPASAVKELVENAIDAGAKNIEIRIQNGGLDLISIQDDGEGMSPEDLHLAVKRHATSKIRNVQDLLQGHVVTFGFRGEAISSIASVSDFEIISKTKNSEYGHKISVRNAQVISHGKAGCKLGTLVLVKNLFANVPARLKFIKSKKSENNAIDKIIRCFSVAHKEVSFKLFFDNKQVFFSSPNPMEQAVALLGPSFKGYLYPLSKNSDYLAIEGFVASPVVKSRDTRNIHLFVNNRLISDKKLLAAIKVAFRSVLEVGNNPSLILNILIANEEVDINVHPRKAEVRFQAEAKVFSHVVRLLSGFLSKTPWLKGCESNEHTKADDIPKKDISWTPSVSTLNKTSPNLYQELLSPKVVSSSPLKSSYSSLTIQSSQMPDKVSYALLPEEKYIHLKYLGQINNLYLLMESQKGLVVIDQHAAHERVMYEKILKIKQWQQRQYPLLIPAKVELNHEQQDLIKEHMDKFKEIGFDLELFGENCCVIRAIPEFFHKENLQTVILEILAELDESSISFKKEEYFHKMCATLACHSAIRAGQKLEKEEVDCLLEELDAIDFSAQCPHGRPLVKWFSKQEMNQWFHRP